MTLHTQLSYVKSIARIVAFGFLPFKILTAAILLIFAEIIGIVEELPGSYIGTNTNPEEKYAKQKTTSTSDTKME